MFKKNNEIQIEVVKSVKDIDLEKSQDVFIRSFMTAYEGIPLTELHPQFKSRHDVRSFYEAYFKDELNNFAKGRLFWVQAFLNNQLVGWATFELETHESDAAYLNLLVVSPEHQRKGIGKYLTFSICSETLFPNIQAINVLIRKVNLEGYNFYRKLGFFDSDYHREDFVPSHLLTGLRWEKTKSKKSIS